MNEDEKTLAVKLSGSTYANLVGGEQKRIVTSITPEELTFTRERLLELLCLRRGDGQRHGECGAGICQQPAFGGEKSEPARYSGYLAF